MIRRPGVEARNSDFIQKARHPRRWRTKVLECHLMGSGHQSLIEQREGRDEEVK